MQVTNSKKLFFSCCKSGPITNTLTLDRTGYVPGEYIVVNAEIDNKSNKTIASSKILLKQVCQIELRRVGVQKECGMSLGWVRDECGMNIG